MRVPVAVVTLACFFPCAVGCISNEYVIPRQELARQAELPPAERGARIHLVQELGERRGDAVDPEIAPYPAGGQEPDVDVALGVRVDGSVNVGSVGGSSRTASGTGGGGTWHGTPATKGASGGSWHGSPTGIRGGGSGGAWRGTPSASSGGGWRGAPSSGGGGGGGGWSGGGGGGGGNIGEAAVVLAVVIAAVAVLAAVGLVASEGVRFDGLADISPGQPVHLKTASGERVVLLAELSPEDVAATVEAKVMDDEGFGIRRLHSVLDRRGFAFKLDLGTTAFRRGATTASGTAGNVEVGGFIAPSLGIFLGASLSGAGDGLGDILTRHAFFLELQSLPLALGRLHAGGYANGGVAMAATTAGMGAAEYGSAFGGGALFELDLTGRMALTLRAGASAARFDTGWSPAATIAGGLAIY